MRILQAISTPPPSWDTGGCTRVAFEISKNLTKLGHDVSIITSDMGIQGRRLKEILNPDLLEGVKIYRFRNISNNMAWKHNIYSNIGSSIFLKREINNFDIIHLHDFRSFQTIAVSFFSKQNNVPYLIQPHGALLDRNNVNGRWIFDRIFGEKSIAGCKKIIALNDIEKKRLQDYGISSSRIIVIPNGIDYENYSGEKHTNSSYYKYNININNKILLYLGRLNKTKRIDLAIRAFAFVKRKFKNINFIIAGPDDGSLHELKLLTNELGLEDDILFIGYLNEEEKNQLLRDSHVLVIPKFTGFPVVILEALASGLPIITTEESDRLDWIQDNAGFIVKSDPDSLADYIIKILTNELLYQVMSMRCESLAKNNFDWKTITIELDEIYKKIVEKGIVNEN
jgi:glycosyltransferase involved in cell wall biosynthesis